MSFLYGRYTDYGTSAEAVIRSHKVNGANILLIGIAAAITSFVVWASHAEIDEVTKGQGKVIPSSSLQTIQNLEGGILSEMLVTEGQRVKKGDVIARIDDTMSGASFRENLAQRDALEAMFYRLFAEGQGLRELKFSDRLVNERPDLVASETELFIKRTEDVDARIAVIDQSLKLASEELSMTIPMVRAQVVSKVDQLRLEREVNELKGERQNLSEEFQSRAMEQFNDTKATLEGLIENLQARKDRVNRAVVLSPVDGTVNEIHVTTVGGVIQPGESILDIVPTGDTLLVQADIRPQDIAFLRPGQKATVKFTAYDFAIYGGLEGEVEHISADTIMNKVDQQHYYQIKVRHKEGAALVKDGEELSIIPGMVAQVDVLTGRRTVLEYLLKPFHRARLNSLTER